MQATDSPQTSEQTLLEQLLQQQQIQLSLVRKQLFVTRLIAGVLALLLAAGIFLAMTALPRVRQVFTDVEQITTQLASVDWKGLADQMDSLARTSQESLTTAADQIAKLDLDSLNQAITDLGEIVRPLAELFGK